MDTNQVEHSPRRFFQNEWFWVAIVAITVAFAIMQDVAHWREDGQNRAAQQLQSVNQKDLWRFLAGGGVFLRSWKLAFRILAVQTLKLALLFGGVFLLSVLAVIRVTRPILKAAIVRQSVWGLWDVMKVAALYALGTVLFAWMFRVNPIAPLASSRGWYAQLFSYILLAGTIICVVTGERGGRLADLGFRGNVLRSLLIAFLALAALQPVMEMIRAAMFRYLREVPLQPALQTMFQTRSAHVLALSLVTAIVVAPVAEELLFRAYLQPALERWFGGAWSILLSALFFAAAHRDLYAAAPTLVLGLTLGYLYNRTRSLAAPVGLHAMFNALSVAQILILRP